MTGQTSVPFAMCLDEILMDITTSLKFVVNNACSLLTYRVRPLVTSHYIWNPTIDNLTLHIGSDYWYPLVTHWVRSLLALHYIQCPTIGNLTLHIGFDFW